MIALPPADPIAPAKRPHLWLDVAERVAAAVPRSRFVIVGDGALRAELQARIDGSGLGDRITLAGRQNPVEPWIAAMDTMLLASEVEGLPNVLLEAQALGVPVVTTDAGGSGEAKRTKDFPSSDATTSTATASPSTSRTAAASRRRTP